MSDRFARIKLGNMNMPGRDLGAYSSLPSERQMLLLALGILQKSRAFMAGLGSQGMRFYLDFKGRLRP